MFSTQLITAYLWRRKVANFFPNKKIINKCPLSKKGLIPNFNKIESLKEYINSDNVNLFNNTFINSFKGSLKRLEEFLFNI